jgi:hypothetical protein
VKENEGKWKCCVEGWNGVWLMEKDGLYRNFILSTTHQINEGSLA